MIFSCREMILIWFIILWSFDIVYQIQIYCIFYIGKKTKNIAENYVIIEAIKNYWFWTKKITIIIININLNQEYSNKYMVPENEIMEMNKNSFTNQTDFL